MRIKPLPDLIIIFIIQPGKFFAFLFQKIFYNIRVDLTGLQLLIEINQARIQIRENRLFRFDIKSHHAGTHKRLYPKRVFFRRGVSPYRRDDFCFNPLNFNRRDINFIHHALFLRSPGIIHPIFVKFFLTGKSAVLPVIKILNIFDTSDIGCIAASGRFAGDSPFFMREKHKIPNRGRDRVYISDGIDRFFRFRIARITAVNHAETKMPDILIIRIHDVFPAVSISEIAHIRTECESVAKLRAVRVAVCRFQVNGEFYTLIPVRYKCHIRIIILM